jgi:non-lysosomal glucosylceramidase
MELFGSNSWLASMYVAALLAGAEMAEAAGDSTFAEKCARLGKAGADFINDTLYNGRYFFQAIDLNDKAEIARFDTGRNAGVLADSFMQAYWSDEHNEIKYQFGGACITDQILGQWHAEVAGLGGFLDKAKVESALAAVYQENFRPTLENHFNPGRNYAYEDEAGLLVATYPTGVYQPMVAAPYAEEVWTGIEYASASHMIMHGLVREGVEIVRAARDRHDGARRNPWNDIECGSYYARSMSAWQLVNAWSGLHADLVDQTLSFDPHQAGDYRLFWSAGTAWGELLRTGAKLTLSVLGGTADLASVAVSGHTFTFPALRHLAAGQSLELTSR